MYLALCLLPQLFFCFVLCFFLFFHNDQQSIIKKGKLHDVYIKIYYGDQSFKTDHLKLPKGGSSSSSSSSSSIKINKSFNFDHPIVCDTNRGNPKLNDHNSVSSSQATSSPPRKHSVMSSVSDITFDPVHQTLQNSGSNHSITADNQSKNNAQKGKGIGGTKHHGLRNKGKTKTDALTKSLISKQARQEIIIKLKQKHRFGKNVGLATYSMSIANLQVGFGGNMKQQYVDLNDDKGQVIASLSVSIAIINKI